MSEGRQSRILGSRLQALAPREHHRGIVVSPQGPTAEPTGAFSAAAHRPPTLGETAPQERAPVGELRSEKARAQALWPPDMRKSQTGDGEGLSKVFF